MAETFENLDTILRDWAKDKVQKSLVEALKRYEKQRRNDKAVFFLENDSEKLLEQSQSVIEQD